MAVSPVIDDIKVIDTDTHVIEPADLWTSRLSTKKWGNLVPHARWDDELQEEAWYFGDERLSATAGGAMAGWHEYPPKHPRRLADVDPALWSAPERLKRMDEYGIWAQVLYPNVAGFGMGKFLGLKNSELMLRCIQAYNDWQTEWASADPSRLLPMTALPFWDIEATCREVERTAAAGHRGIIMAQQPDFFGLPMLADPHWDPLWATAQDVGQSVNFHIASGDLSLIEKNIPSNGLHANYASVGVSFFMGNASTIATLICAGICHRFPRLNFVSVESGVGWIPYALAALDWQWKNCGVPLEHPEYDLLPSEYFQRQIHGCFWFENETAKQAIELLGADNILYETDFPHPTSMSPGPATAAVRPDHFIEGALSDLPRDVLRKILHDNAARIYHLD
ncbi:MULTISPECIES: amidohydrolase family protein [Pseudofrankia]|uniref:amidohydrolase family protein n=1 Tax=Pseudofrankia TaxID=2994363 RepID=UPI000234D839|nr:MULTISPECIES: amidohydrolase family protein [Pseudofrankia]OHV31866.1 amidohydrolase [Pseudofrankia sp. EUN1h]